MRSEGRDPVAFRGRRWPKIVLALASLVAVVLGLEGAVRLWVLVRHDGNTSVYNIWNTIYESHPHSWLRVKPGRAFDVLGGAYRVEVDSRGFRSPEPLPVKPDNGFRIAFLGGSTTFNSAAPTYAQTLPALVGRSIQAARPGLSVEVLNAGTAGYTTMESLTTLVTRVLPLKPDLIVVYHGINDAVFRGGDDYREDYWRPPKPATRLLDTELYRRSQLLRLAIYKATMRRRPKPSDPARLVRNFEGHGTETFERNLRNIVAVATANGANVVLSTFATCPGVDAGDADEWKVLLQAVDRQNERVRDLAVELGTPLVDVARLLPRDPALFTDRIHRSVDGLAAHAAILSEAILSGDLPGPQALPASRTY